jgi:hypothetical protein
MVIGLKEMQYNALFFCWRAAWMQYSASESKAAVHFSIELCSRQAVRQMVTGRKKCSTIQKDRCRAISLTLCLLLLLPLPVHFCLS